MNHSHSLRPRIRLGEHPVETGDYVIHTPPIEETFQVVFRWIRNKVPGGMISGVQRIGKTRCTMFLPSLIKSEFGHNIPIYTLDCEYSQRPPGEERFYVNWLNSIGHPVPTSGRIKDKKIRLIEYLRTQLALNGEKRMVVILDDAQNLWPEQYCWLMDIYNELDRNHFRSLFLLVGQQELESVRNVFISEGKQQIIGRFMVRRHRFRALEDEEDIRYCLAQYDDHTEYPENSGCSYTRYFFTYAYDAGWRLANLSHTLWEGFKGLKSKSKVSGSVVFYIPMQEFARSVEYILTEYSDIENSDPIITPEQVQESIFASGFLDVIDQDNIPKFAPTN